MHKQRNIRLAISLVILIVITTGLYMSTGKNTSTVSDPDIFKADFTNIDSVVLQHPNDTITIAYNGIRWLVNGQYQADRQMIDLLFATLQQAVPTRPVASGIRDSITTQLTTEGIRVSLYAGENLQKNFYAGGNPRKTQAYFLDPETSTPYLMAIPGYRVYTSGILELNESGWRDKLVFPFNWRNFERMEVTFPGKPGENFRVARGNDFFEIEGGGTTDTSRLNTFLDDVSLLVVDQYLDEKRIDMDSLLQQELQMHILITDIGNRQYSLSVFPQRDGQQGVPGIINGSQPALLNFRQVRNIIRPKSYFLRE